MIVCEYHDGFTGRVPAIMEDSQVADVVELPDESVKLACGGVAARPDRLPVRGRIYASKVMLLTLIDDWDTVL